jgi:hypothetical protein
VALLFNGGGDARTRPMVLVKHVGINMAESFIVYVDESGDEGFNFVPNSSSQWFVLSAVIVREHNDAVIRNTLADVRKMLGKGDNFALHFRKLRHEQRIPYVQTLGKLPIRTVSVLVHKPCLKEPETFRHYRLYHYCVRLLLERVSWLCRDEHQKSLGDGSARIICSNRSAMSYIDLREYVRKLVNTGNPLAVRIESSVIKPDQIESKQHAQYAGLQAADAVASSFFFAAQTHRLGFTEPRYVECLTRVVYRHAHEAIGYGVKFWPKDSYELVKASPLLEWAGRLFGKK